MVLRLYEIRVDNNPGGWKSGSDSTYLVVAESMEDSIEKFTDSYGSNWVFDEGTELKTYRQKKDSSEGFSSVYIAKDARISSTEIQFDGFDIEFTNRETKIDELLK